MDIGLKDKVLNMDDFNSAASSMAVQLSVMAAKGTAQMVATKIQAIRQKKKIDEMSNSYEELINELVADRAQAIAIAQAYESELNRYEIGDDDIRHLQNTISEVLDILKSFSPNLKLDDFEKFKSLISVDTLKAMQLIGFDYRAGIGQPLTEACADAIKAKLKVSPNKGLSRQSNSRKH